MEHMVTIWCEWKSLTLLFKWRTVHTVRLRLRFTSHNSIRFSAIVTITPCEHLHWVPYNPFLTIKNCSRNGTVWTDFEFSVRNVSEQCFSNWQLIMINEFHFTKIWVHCPCFNRCLGVFTYLHINLRQRKWR